MRIDIVGMIVGHVKMQAKKAAVSWAVAPLAPLPTAHGAFLLLFFETHHGC